MKANLRTSGVNWTVLLFGVPVSRREPALLGQLRFRGVGLAQLERELPLVAREEFGRELADRVCNLAVVQTEATEVR